MGETKDEYEAWTRPWRVAGWLLLTGWLVAVVGARPKLVPRQEAMEESFWGLGTFWAFDVPMHVEPWAMALFLVVLLATVGLLVRGPQPLRLTRGGWAWPMLLMPELVVPVYLILGGPTGVGGAPRRAERWDWMLGVALALVVSFVLTRLFALL